MERLSRPAFLNRLTEASRRLRTPQFVTFELSYACNLTCAHCFNPTHSASRRELSAPEISRLIDEIAALGAWEILFTGGEAVLRPSLLAFMERARGLGLSVALNTNATRITPELAAWLGALGLTDVSVSLYGVSRGVYESVTGKPGSHQSFLRGLDALAGTRIPVTLQMPVMDLNRGEVLEAKRFAKARGFRFLPVVDIYPRQDGELSPLARRLSPAQKLAVLAELGTKPSSCRPEDASSEFIDCDCGKSQFAITPYGEMNLCTIFPHPRFDLRKGSVREGWEVLKRTVDEAKPGASYECPSCELRGNCRQGRADSWLEKKDMSACLPHYEELARLEAERDARVPVA